MKLVTPKQAVEAIPDHSIAIMPGGCARASALYMALVDNINRFHNLTLCSGFSFSPYSYLEQGLGSNTRYFTWQASPRVRELFTKPDPKKVGFVPIRLSDLHHVICVSGQIQPNVVVVQTSCPQSDGSVSLGISVGANRDFIRSADLVIAEMNSNMPVTHGDSRIDFKEIDLAYESDEPMWEYIMADPQPVDAKIVEHVMSIVPDGAWIQLGIGSIPDCIMQCLSEVNGINIWSGLLTSGLQDLIEKSSVTPRIVVGELAGTKSFYDFCHQNSMIEMAPTSVTHDLSVVAKLAKFTSINSALEIDLQGQSNGETIGGVQISGVGGSLDYIEAANLSQGGISVIAMPSTTNNGKRSKIVHQFSGGTVVTTPRYCTDYVVTEYGVARMRGKDLFQRAEALIAIAHPKFRDELAREMAW